MSGKLVLNETRMIKRSIACEGDGGEELKDLVLQKTFQGTQLNENKRIRA